MQERFEQDGKVVIKTTYDPTETIEANAAARAEAPKHKISNGKVLVKVMDIPMEHIEALINSGYNLLSPDPDEVRRCLLYIQTHEPVWKTVNGTPIAAFQQKWV